MIESGAWIILLEAAVALGLLLFIVWWTLPKNANRGGEKADGERRDEDGTPR